MPTVKTIHAHLDGQKHKIIIGKDAVRHIGPWLSAQKPSRVFIFADRKLRPHQKNLLETLQKKGITPDVALAQLVERAQAAA